jgi:hypothetical protein
MIDLAGSGDMQACAYSHSVEDSSDSNLLMPHLMLDQYTVLELYNIAISNRITAVHKSASRALALGVTLCPCHQAYLVLGPLHW